MPLKPAEANLEDFARTGNLGPIRLRMTRAEVFSALGPPTNCKAGKTVASSPLLKYGDLELYFDKEDCLSTIHFDSFQVPVGGPTLILSPWIIRQGLPLAALEAALRDAGIPHVASRDLLNPDCLQILTSANVSFLVQVQGEPDELGLQQFGHSVA